MSPATTPRRFTLPLQLLLAVLLPAVATAQQADTVDLFEPSTQRAGAPSGEQIPGLRSDAVGAVSFFAVSPAARQSLRSAPGAKRSMRVALPGGRSVTCRFAAQDPGSDTLAGSVADSDSPADRCDLVVTGGEVVGDIQTESGRYRIVPMPGGTHAVVEMKPGAYPNEGDIPLPPLPPGVQRKGERSLRDAPRCDVPPAKVLGPIRILVLYTPQAKAETGNIKAEISLAMQQLNDAFRKTGGNFGIKAELAHAQEVDYVEGDDMEVDLNRVSGQEPGYLPEVAGLRAQYRADLVHLLIGLKPGNPCGIGWMPPLDTIGPATRDWAYSVSERGCAINNYSFVHELGHNLGLNHDRYVAGDNSPADYNFGYVVLPKAMRTVMAYDNECQANGFSCQRYPLFSTPAVRIRDVPIGEPSGAPNGAYNIEILCRTAPIVANYY
jgi:hypothetical protein